VSPFITLRNSFRSEDRGLANEVLSGLQVCFRLLHPGHILRYENVISESAGESSGCAIPATGLFDTQCHLILVELSLICHHPGRIAAWRDLFGSCDSSAIAPKRWGDFATSGRRDGIAFRHTRKRPGRNYWDLPSLRSRPDDDPISDPRFRAPRSSDGYGEATTSAISNIANLVSAGVAAQRRASRYGTASRFRNSRTVLGVTARDLVVRRVTEPGELPIVPLAPRNDQAVWIRLGSSVGLGAACSEDRARTLCEATRNGAVLWCKHHKPGQTSPGRWRFRVQRVPRLAYNPGAGTNMMAETDPPEEELPPGT
jgi:hypothetical protein